MGIASILGVDEDTLRQRSVKEKFDLVFSRIIALMLGDVLLLVLTLVFSALGLTIPFFIFCGIDAVCLALTLWFILAVKAGLTESVLIPVKKVSFAAEEMAAGKLDIRVDYDAKDEFAVMAKDLVKASAVISGITHDIINTLNRLSAGDFSKGSENPGVYLKDYIRIRDAFEDITNELSETMSNVRDSSLSVSQGAQNMSQGAADLAEGATDQAAAIEEVTASITNVAEQSKGMSDVSDESAQMALRIKEQVETGMRKMKLVTDAMERITLVSREIEQITNSIENIANQTRLLALNASIESARAGESGKGFAVVAENISNLANESTVAAKNTHQLISDTMDEIANGNAVVEETKTALEEVEGSVTDMSMMMYESGELARQQVEMIDEIAKAIDMISNVVQTNSATAEESSAVSGELFEQSEGLHRLIDNFVIKQ